MSHVALCMPQVAHYFEFIFEALSGGISFMFCMDNKFLCDAAQRQLLAMQNLACNQGEIGVIPENIVTVETICRRESPVTHEDCSGHTHA